MSTLAASRGRRVRDFSRLLVGLTCAAVATRVDAAGVERLELDGVLGDRIALGPPAQARPAVLFFMSRRAADECAAFGRAVDEQILDAAVESVAIVDVRAYGGWLRRLAMARLKKSATEALERRRTRRVARGADASSEVVGRWHLVGDFDGSLFSRFGVERELAHPAAFVLDRNGTLLGPFHDAHAVVTAVGGLTRAR